MKRRSTPVILTALALSASTLCAQDNPPPRPPETAPNAPARRPDGDRPRPMPGIFGMLDANHDGSLDVDELHKAAEALRKLDRNNDHKISADEFPGGTGQREHHDRTRSGDDRRSEGDRERQSPGDRPRNLRNDGDQARQPRDREQHDRRQAASDSRRDGDQRRDAQRDHRPSPPPQTQGRDGERAPLFTHRPPQSGDPRRDQRRHDAPRLAPRMEGAPRPPMSGPPSDQRFQQSRPPMPPMHHKPAPGFQPRHDGRPDADRMPPHPPGGPGTRGENPMMHHRDEPRPPQDRGPGKQPPGHGSPHGEPPHHPEQQPPGAI